MSEYNNEHDRVVGEVASSAFMAATDSIIDVHSAVKVLAITVTSEIVLFAMYYVSKDKVLDFLADPENGNFWLYGSAGIFLLGFFTAFAIYRLIANKWPHRGSYINIWLVSIATGILNFLLFFALTSFALR